MLMNYLYDIAKRIYMKSGEILAKRSDDICELCKAEQLLKIYGVPPDTAKNENECILICDRYMVQNM